MAEKNHSIKMVALGKLKLNEENPRYITDDKFNKLKESIKAFPEMLKIRPIVVDDDMTILGGNMRYRACLELDIEEVPVLMAKGLTDEQKEEFLYRDNVAFGDWDWSVIKDENWDKLISWGVNPSYHDKQTKEEAEIKSTAEVISNMGLKFNEHHDYVVFLFDNQNDWIKLISHLDLPKIPKSLSPKIKLVGRGRVVDGKKLLKILDHETEEGNSK